MLLFQLDFVFEVFLVENPVGEEGVQREGEGVREQRREG